VRLYRCHSRRFGWLQSTPSRRYTK